MTRYCLAVLFLVAILVTCYLLVLMHHEDQKCQKRGGILVSRCAEGLPKFCQAKCYRLEEVK